MFLFYFIHDCFPRLFICSRKKMGEGQSPTVGMFFIFFVKNANKCECMASRQRIHFLRGFVTSAVIRGNGSTYKGRTRKRLESVRCACNRRSRQGLTRTYWHAGSQPVGCAAMPVSPASQANMFCHFFRFHSMLPNPQRKAAVSVMHVRQPIAAIVTLG
jgi:hypothetical protein